MKRSLQLSAFVGLVAGLSWWGVAALSPVAEGIPPEHLLPEQSVVLVHCDGSSRHAEGMRETAVWKALEDTGLREKIFDLVETAIASNSQEAASVARQLLDNCLEHGVSLGISVSPDGQQVAPYGVLVLPQSGSLLNQLTAIAAQVQPDVFNRVRQREIAGRDVSYLIAPPGIEVAWWSEGSHLVIAAGMDPVTRVLESATGVTGNVTRSELWQELRSSDDFTVTCLGWLETKSLLDQFGEMPFPSPPEGKSLTIREFADMLGVAELEAITSHSGFQGAATHSRTEIVAPGPRKRLLKLLDQRAMTLNEIPPVPKDATGLMAWSFNIRQAVDSVMETIEVVVAFGGEDDKAEFDESLAEFTEAIGGDPRDVFSAGLGDVFCVYNDPTSMPFLMGFGPVATASVENRSRLEQTLDRLFQIAGSIPDAQEFNVEKTTSDGNTIYLIKNRSGVPIIPSIMVSDEWLVAGIMPAAARSFMARVDGTLPSWEPDQEVKKALADMPDKFTSILISDPTPGYTTLMTMAPMGLGFLQMQETWPNGQPMRLPFGIQDLPSAEEVTASMFTNVSMSTVTDRGVVMYGRESVPGTPIGGVGTTAAAPVLVALLLPAVQQAREAARRTQSMNNLRNLGLALHMHYDTYGSLPRGTVENNNLVPDERIAWTAALLPYLDQQGLAQNIDTQQGWQAPANAAIAGTTVDVFQNPSHARPEESPGSMDYVAIAGIGPDAAELPKSDPRAGIFGYNRTTRFRDVTDGLSNTIAITDSAQPNQSFLQGGRASIRGFSQQPYINGPDGIGGPHAGGMNVLFGDGSVRFVSEDIDPTVLEAIATMAGGEAVGGF